MGSKKTPGWCTKQKGRGLCGKRQKVDAGCQKTCGLCGSTAGDLAPPTPSDPVAKAAPSIETAPASAGCTDTKKTPGWCAKQKGRGLCGKRKQVDAGCQKTCGLCGSTAATAALATKSRSVAKVVPAAAPATKNKGKRKGK